MSLVKTRCPKCARKLMLPKSSGNVRCPKCAHRFAANGAADSTSKAFNLDAIEPSLFIANHDTAPAPPPLAMAIPATSLPAETAGQTPANEEDTVALDNESWSLGPVVAIGTTGVAVLGLGVWLLVWCLVRPELPDEAPPETFVNAPVKNGSLPWNGAEPQIILAAAKFADTPTSPMFAKTAPLQGAVKPVAATNVGHPGVDQAKVDQALERGVAFLKKSYQVGNVGAQALAGLTLLHCGEAVNNAAVLDIARTVRGRAANLTATYELAVCVMFLDRLGDAADRPLIRSIALQLIAGQGIMGAWNYNCPMLNASQQQELFSLLNAPFVVRDAGKMSFERKGIGGRSAILPNNLADLPVLQYRPGTPLKHQFHGHEDNSLAQFAILALWAAQKHGIPAERSLAFTEARFRSSQASDGAWSYTWTPNPNRHRADSMTCAGLLGLAVGRGTHAIAKDANSQQGDDAIEKALRYIGQRIGQPGTNQMNGEKPTGNAGGLQRGSIVGALTWGDLYFLWTLERVAVAYDLKTIGGKDWYAWGAPILLNRQAPHGGWTETHGVVPDTCFAMLFLKRANVAVDLTARLQHLAISKQLVERRDADAPDRRSIDPFDRRPDLSLQQREAAGYARGSIDER